MQRRQFIDRSLLASAAALAGTSLSHAAGRASIRVPDSPFHLDYAIHDGMFRNQAGNDFIDQIKYAYDILSHEENKKEYDKNKKIIIS